ncbi:MAG: Gfo/Idh/MocA family oxidoreductase [Anaerolineales bacterium]|nr:Gfo/Idh/MocA family oxidoreductase [Anaerolineales bacterium]MDW8277284.1 Gfo/Idh/MocA family oxidoreductase [Anaerolineales bacterium]
MSKSTLQWGLLSTARINRALIPPLRVSPRNHLLAVASRSPESAASYAREWNIPRAYGTYEDLLADPEIDVIYNPLPNHLHKEWTIRAVRAGKHVLCEKPLALSPAEVDEMALVAQQHGKVIAEAFMYRHHPQTLKVKELVERGAIGKLQLIRGAFTFRMKTETNIRLNLEMGGGSIWDVGCYPISYARYLAGTEPVEVFGWQVTGKTGIDDSFFGQMKFPNGVYAQFDSGFRSPYRSFVEVVGAEGTIFIPTPFKPGWNETITLTREDGAETIPVPGADLYLGEVEDLADSILTGTLPRVTLADSRGNAAAIAALLESARSGKPIQI